MSFTVATGEVSKAPPTQRRAITPPTTMDDPRALPFQSVRITAADFNGQAFDGPPFEPVYPTATGAWFSEAIRSGKIKIESHSTDYAWFAVADEYGNTTVAGPGDYISTFDNGLIMVIPKYLAEQFGIGPMVGE